MKIKLFQEMNAGDLEELVNGFISNDDIEVLGMDFSANDKGLAVMITYKNHGRIHESEGIY